MWTRRTTLLLAIAVASCREAPKELAQALPREVGPGWSLQQSKPLPVEEAPAAARMLSLTSSVTATYKDASGKPLSLRLLDMKAETNAFELVQKWRPQDGQALYKGRYFFVAEAPDHPPSTVSAFLRAFQGALPAQ